MGPKETLKRFEGHRAAETRDTCLHLSVRWRLDLLWERQIQVFDLIRSLHLCFPYPREKSQLSFQDILDVQFYNTILGILDPKEPLLER